MAKKVWKPIGLLVLYLSMIPLVGCLVQTGVSESEYEALEAEYEGLEAELAQLKATKEINFGNGLRIFDISLDGITVRGKIENVSGAPMKKVKVLVAYYDEDGSLAAVGDYTVENLFMGEVSEWSMYGFYSWSGLFDVYAIGNRED